VFAVPAESHRERELHDVNELSPELKQELEKFFVATDELEDKSLRFVAWQGPAEAKKLVRSCEKAFKKKR
jgi:inorganic pyrophosphatase